MSDRKLVPMLLDLALTIGMHETVILLKGIVRECFPTAYLTIGLAQLEDVERDFYDGLRDLEDTPCD